MSELPPPAGMMTVTYGIDRKVKVPVFDEEQMHQYARAAVLAEREACAKVAELVAREIDDTNGTATYISATIRARGESK